MNIRETAIKYLEHRSRSCGEMEKHLQDKGFEEDEISQTIEELKSIGYLNDMEYSISYLNYGFSKGKGLKLIKYELYDKGIESDIIKEALDLYEDDYGIDLKEDEYERAKVQAEKITEEQEFSEKMRDKVARRLSSKGYTSETIMKVLSNLREQENEAANQN